MPAQREGITLDNQGNQRLTAFTFGDMVTVIRRYWLLIGIVMGVFAVLGYLFGSTAEPSYEAEALLISDAQKSGIVGYTSESGGENADPSLTTTVVETLNSEVVLDRLISSLSEDTMSRLAAITLANSDEAEQAVTNRDSVLRRYVSNHLNVTNSGRSYVVRAQFTSTDPQLAASLANSLVDAYLTYRHEIKERAYAQVVEDLTKELATLGDELTAAEETAQVMRERVDLLTRRSESLMGAQREQAIEESANLFAQRRAAERKADVVASVYQQLLYNQRNIMSRIAAPELSVQLFSPAVVPTKPTGLPATFLLTPLGLIFGFFLGMTIAIRLYLSKQGKSA